MDRRRFLKTLGLTALAAATADAVLDPEFALWKPGAKRIVDLGAARPTETVAVWSHWDQFVNGYIFTIDGKHSVNPVTRQSTGHLQQFVVTDTAHASDTGIITIGIWPPTVVSPDAVIKPVWAPPVGRVGREDRWFRPRIRRA